MACTFCSPACLQTHFLVAWFLLLITHDDGKTGPDSTRLGHETAVDLAGQLARVATAIEVRRGSKQADSFR